MNTVIKIIGIVIVVFAIVFLSRPDIIRAILAFFTKGILVYLAAIVRFILGILFLVGAQKCHIPWLMVALGILFLISGLLVFIIGAAKCCSMLRWWQKQSALLLRLLTLFPLTVGALIIYAA